MKLTDKRDASRLSLSFPFAVPRGAGGANRDRTGDLLLAKQALSQLSYGPFAFAFPESAPCFAIERGARWWWVWVDLNHRPHAYQACALTN